jgi:hypothetical protein
LSNRISTSPRLLPLETFLESSICWPSIEFGITHISKLPSALPSALPISPLLFATAMVGSTVRSEHSTFDGRGLALDPIAAQKFVVAGAVVEQGRVKVARHLGEQGLERVALADGGVARAAFPDVGVEAEGAGEQDLDVHPLEFGHERTQVGLDLVEGPFSEGIVGAQHHDHDVGRSVDDLVDPAQGFPGVPRPTVS